MVVNLIPGSCCNLTEHLLQIRSHEFGDECIITDFQGGVDFVAGEYVESGHNIFQAAASQHIGNMMYGSYGSSISY